MSNIINKRLGVLFLVLVFLAPVSLGALDFGLHLNQSAGVGGHGDDTGVDYEAVLVPRFFTLLGTSGDMFLSAGIMATYGNGEWGFVPELLRNEFSWRFGDTNLRIGRIPYSDPMALVASGLFDGAMVSRNTIRGTLGMGVWYTGLLYRHRANIAMSDADVEALQMEFDPSNFTDTYFASRRLMATLYWDHPSITQGMQLNVAIIGQADLNNTYRVYHSQYLVVKSSLAFQRFIFELGGALEVGQTTYETATGTNVDLSIGLAADLGLHWMPPARFYNMLSFTGRFTGGKAESGPMSAFTPITSLSHGQILRAEIPGLSMFGLSYTARLRPTFSAALTAQHFVRTDEVTYIAFPLSDDPDGNRVANRFLGTEFFARFIWSPVSEITMNLGAGAFLPSLGDVAPDADPLWRVELAITFALF
ncbi:MAG: hypothetical protein FWB78_06780 [Treponema sp.]|nr:hypothetical protein [Treponema sp.]